MKNRRAKEGRGWETKGNGAKQGASVLEQRKEGEAEKFGADGEAMAMD